MNHFDHVWQQFHKDYPKSTVTEEQFRAAYIAHYTCLCDTCQFRKVSGYEPYNLHDKCNAPTESLNLARIATI